MNTNNASDQAKAQSLKPTQTKEIQQIQMSEGEFNKVRANKNPDPNKKKYDENVQTVMYSPADFRQMNESKFFNNYDSAEILHDPTATSAGIEAGNEGGSENKTAAPRMLKADWQKKYTEVFGLEPDGALTVPQLQKLIEEKEKEGQN
jgi:hypothetical protein